MQVACILSAARERPWAASKMASEGLISSAECIRPVVVTRGSGEGEKPKEGLGDGPQGVVIPRGGEATHKGTAQVRIGEGVTKGAL